jgi:hypothetical protein
MNKITQFLNFLFEKAHWFWVFLFGVALTLVILIPLTFLVSLLPIENHNLLPLYKISFFFSPLMGLLTVFFRNATNDIVKFDDLLSDITIKLDNAKTKQEIQSLFDNEYKVLLKNNTGTPRANRELGVLFGILKTKYDLFDE